MATGRNTAHSIEAGVAIGERYGIGRGKVGGDGFVIASFEFESFFSESEFFSFTMMDLPLSPAITSMKATGQPVDGTTHPASV